MADEFKQSAQEEVGNSRSEQQRVPRNISTNTIQNVLLGLMITSILCMVFKPQEDKHDVPLKEEHESQILECQLKIEEIKRSVELSKRDAEREVAEGVRVLIAFKESVVRHQAKLIETIKENQRMTEKQAEGFIRELQQVNSELKRIRSEVELFSAAPLGQTLAEEVRKERLKLLAKAELKRVRQYAVAVTLDPDTAHPLLFLSGDGKQVIYVGVRNNLPDNPERFDTCVNVLGNQSFSSGRFYYEVQVKGKTQWDLGVVRESVNRKGEITLQPQTGYWVILLRNENEYEAADDPAVDLFLKSKPGKVGVFVDYEEGLVSFYDVDAAALIYSFTSCSFTERLFPFFSPANSDHAPLIITPVNHYG